MRRRHAAGGDRLDQHHLRPEAPPVAAAQHLGLGALDVDLEEVDRGDAVRLAELGKRRDRHPTRAVGRAERFRAARVTLERARKAVQPVDLVEVGLARPVSDERAEREVARTDLPVQRRKMLLRLDRNAAPALEIEVERDVVADRMPGADIDVEPRALAFEELGEVIVLEVLRVGQIHRRGVSGGLPSL